MRYWWSVVTCAAYLAVLPFLSPLLESVLLGLAMVALAVTSAGFHWYEHEKKEMPWHSWKSTPGYIWQKADEISMFAAFWAVYAYLLGDPAVIPLCIAATVAMGFLHDKFHSETVGALAVMCLILKATINWPLALAGTAIFLGSLYLNRLAIKRDDERLHGLWHIGATGGFLCLVA